MRAGTQPEQKYDSHGGARVLIRRSSGSIPEFLRRQASSKRASELKVCNGQPIGPSKFRRHRSGIGQPYYSFSIDMISKATLGRSARSALRRQCQANPNSRRGLAAAASGSFTYETGEAAGVKFASRDLPGPTTHIAVVAKAGSRYQPLPGLTDALEQFAFKVCPG
jgi:hypothetical protein